MSDDLDALDALRRAMAALAGEAPAGYFETLPERTLARLDDPTIGELPDEPGRKHRREPASEPPVRPLRVAQGGPSLPDADADADADAAVFSSQIMAAVELTEPAEREALPRTDRASSSSVVTVLPAPPRSKPAAEAVASPGAAPAPVSTALAGPVEAPAGAVASMAVAGTPGHRRSRRVRAAIVGVGGIGLAAVAVIYLAAGGQAPRSAPPTVSLERAAPASAPAALPGAGGGPPVASAAPGSAAHAEPVAAGGSVVVATPPAPGPGSAATSPESAAGTGSAAAQGSAPLPVPEPIGKFGGSPGKRPGSAKTATKGGGKPPARVAPGTGSDAQRSSGEPEVLGKKVKASKPRPDRTSLSGDDIERAMAAVAGKARACFAGTGGTASLRLTVAPSGRIARVAVTGPFAGTPAGACLQRAVRAATFPPWSGGPQSFDYSYPLSD